MGGVWGFESWPDKTGMGGIERFYKSLSYIDIKNRCPIALNIYPSLNNKTGSLGFINSNNPISIIGKTVNKPNNYETQTSHNR
jgi:hypothetical protein